MEETERFYRECNNIDSKVKLTNEDGLTIAMMKAHSETEIELKDQRIKELEGLLAAHKGVSDGKSIIIKQLENKLSVHENQSFSKCDCRETIIHKN